MRNIGNSPCPCGEWIMGTLTGNVKKCDEHPGELCWLWEWEAGTICPKCGATQNFLHQPESRPTPRAADGSLREPTIIKSFPMRDAYPAGHKPRHR